MIYSFLHRFVIFQIIACIQWVDFILAQSRILNYRMLAGFSDKFNKILDKFSRAVSKGTHKERCEPSKGLRLAP